MSNDKLSCTIFLADLILPLTQYRLRITVRGLSVLTSLKMLSYFFKDFFEKLPVEKLNDNWNCLNYKFQSGQIYYQSIDHVRFEKLKQ